jgi:hypothetical protein
MLDVDIIVCGDEVQGFFDGSVQELGHHDEKPCADGDEPRRHRFAKDAKKDDEQEQYGRLLTEGEAQAQARGQSGKGIAGGLEDVEETFKTDLRASDTTIGLKKAE